MSGPFLWSTWQGRGRVIGLDFDSDLFTLIFPKRIIDGFTEVLGALAFHPSHLTSPPPFNTRPPLCAVSPISPSQGVGVRGV